MFQQSLYLPLSAMSIIMVPIIVLVVYLVSWAIYTRTLHPLSKVPGPFLASMSRFLLVITFQRRNLDEVERSLHQKYGPIIRVAPDEVVCADPSAIKQIYRFQNPLAKTDFYSPFASGRKVFSEHLDLFAELNDKKHGERRRITNHIYALGNVLRFEPFLDECSEVFIDKMGQFADAGDPVDMGEWLQWYTFDVIGQLFFGGMFGFMQKETDYESWIEAVDRLFPYIVTMSLAPEFARPLVGFSAVFNKAARKGFEAMNRIVDAAKLGVSQRMEQLQSADDSEYRHDLLQQMLDIVRDKGEKVDFSIGDIQMDAHVALFAGSDTTAILLRAVVYYLLKDPDVYREVQAEIDQAANTGLLSSDVKYSEGSKLPFLGAIIKEANRLHPGAAMSLPRVAPVEGIELAGTYIPQGYRVGVNPATVQRDKSIFGSDADHFRPARWLEGNAAIMDKHILTFGAGTRTCIGKHIALVEVHKLLPHLLRDFDLELIDPEGEWIVYNNFINKQTNIHVRIKRRRLSSK